MDKNFADELRSIAQNYDAYAQNDYMINNYIKTLISEEILPKAKYEASCGKFLLEYTYDVDTVAHSMHLCQLPYYFSKTDALAGAMKFKELLTEQLGRYGLILDSIEIHTAKMAKHLCPKDGRRWLFDYKNMRIRW